MSLHCNSAGRRKISLLCWPIRPRVALPRSASGAPQPVLDRRHREACAQLPDHRFDIQRAVTPARLAGAPQRDILLGEGDQRGFGPPRTGRYRTLSALRATTEPARSIVCWKCRSQQRGETERRHRRERTACRAPAPEGRTGGDEASERVMRLATPFRWLVARRPAATHARSIDRSRGLVRPVDGTGAASELPHRQQTSSAGRRHGHRTRSASARGPAA